MRPKERDTEHFAIEIRCFINKLNTNYPMTTDLLEFLRVIGTMFKVKDHFIKSISL